MYEVELKRRAIKDLDGLSPDLVRRILEKIELMRNELAGDVKRLTSFTPEYRLRVGDYRVLFQFEGNVVIIYRIKHRREAYGR